MSVLCVRLYVCVCARVYVCRYDTDAKDSGDNSDQGSGSEVNEEVAPKAKKRKMSKSTTSAPKPVKKEVICY